MPLYDFKCAECGATFEALAGMNQPGLLCRCGALAEKQFSPNSNILIPGYFRMDRGWHLPPGGSETASSPDVNSRVRPPQRTSFKEKFDKAWRG